MLGVCHELVLGSLCAGHGHGCVRQRGAEHDRAHSCAVPCPNMRPRWVFCGLRLSGPRCWRCWGGLRGCVVISDEVKLRKPWQNLVEKR